MSLDSISELWQAICDEIKKHISDVGFNVWLREITPVSIETNTLILGIPNEYKKQIVDSQYKSLLHDCCLAVSGLDLDIELLVTGEGTADDALALRQRIVSGGIASYTFDNFIVGGSNEFAHAASLAVAENPSAAYNPLFIYGDSGVGKTHLILAIKNYIEKKYPDKIVEYMRAEEFANRIIEAIHSNTTKIFHDRYRSIDVLLIDDIHFIAGKESTQEEFFNTFNVLYMANKQIVLTSDRPPKEIASLEERIRSRFEGGLIASIAPPDYETRVGIIRNKARELGLDLDEDITFFIADQIKKNTRQLEGVVKKLQAYIKIQNHEPTVSVVQSIIKDIISDSMPEPVTIDDIIAEVERTYLVSKEDILSKRKLAEIAFARQVSIYVAKQVTSLSFVAIGKYFDKDHTTVIHSIKKIEEIIKRDPSQKKNIEGIIKNLQR